METPERCSIFIYPREEAPVGLQWAKNYRWERALWDAVEHSCSWAGGCQDCTTQSPKAQAAEDRAGAHKLLTKGGEAQTILGRPQKRMVEPTEKRWRQADSTLESHPGSGCWQGYAPQDPYRGALTGQGLKPGLEQLPLCPADLGWSAVAAGCSGRTMKPTPRANHQ